MATLQFGKVHISRGKSNFVRTDEMDANKYDFLLVWSKATNFMWEFTVRTFDSIEMYFSF